MRLFVTYAIMLFILGLPSVKVTGQQFDSLSLSLQAAESRGLYLSNPERSIQISNQLIANANEVDNKYFKGYGNYLLSKAYWAKGNYQLSTKYGFSALTILEETPYKYMWGETLVALARTLIDLKNFDQADQFLGQAMALASTSHHDKLEADVSRERSMFFLEQKKYDSALYCANHGIAYYETISDTLNLSVLYGRKASIYASLKDYKTSMTFNKLAIRFDSIIDNKRALGIAYYQAAFNEFNLRHLETSAEFLNKSINLVHENGSFKTLIKAHSLFGEIYLNQNKPELGYQELKLVSQFKDSLYSVERSGQVQEMQSLYELGKKEATIINLELEKKNQRILAIVLIAGIVLLLLLIFVLWRLRIVQKRANDALAFKNQSVEHQREEMQTQAENLQELNNLKSKLFSVISHDLRGPIGNLQALLDMVTRRIMTPEEFISVSHRLKENLNVTQRTLENLLSWSLSQMEGLKTEQDRFDIRHLIDEACRLLEEVAQRKNITLETSSETCIPVLADHNQIQLIIRNLLHNAIKFSREDGTVVLTALTDDEFCHISIRDNGIGMTSKETNMLLEKNQHFTKAGTHQEKGTGLGLMLCQEFVKRNGGSLTIESNPGAGTSVSFTVPLAVTELLTQAPQVR
ncbi:MAG: HAMP domain-containing sensor histidine kinase [Chryseolinea sp.]